MLGKFLFGLTIATSLFFAPHAQATSFTFTYLGSDGLSGFVNISGTQSSPGVFEITSGADTVTGGSGLIGTFTLLQNVSYPTAINSPSGYFSYDNLLSPSLDPFVNNSGLLFTSGRNEVNLFSNGPGDYIHYDNGGYNVPIIVSALTTIQDTAVPEPVSLALLGTGLVCLGFMRRRVPSRSACG